MANAEWYYSRNGQQVGPLTAEVMKQMAAAGQIVKTDFVWKDGFANWLPADQVQGLFPSHAASADPLEQLAGASSAAAGSAAAASSSTTAYRPVKGESHGGAAVAGMVVSILAFALGGAWLIILGVIGLLISAIAVTGMTQSKNEEGKGMAVAGILLGLIAAIIGILVAVFQGVVWFWKTI